MNYDQLQIIVTGKGYKWFTEAWKPNLIGVRTNLVIPNVYNDLMFLAYVTDKGEKKIFAYSQTTLPGKFWLNSPLSPKGTGILIPGQYVDCWVKGTHGHTRPHDALLQIGGGVNVVRDNDKDSIPELTGPNTSVEKNVYIGLNIHASWAIGDRKTIDKDSAACQVASNSWNHEQMMKVVDAYYASKLGKLPTNAEIMAKREYQVKISYTLLTENDLK